MVYADDRSFGIDQLLRRLLVATVSLALSACSSLPVVYSQSDNFNSRVNHVVIHFTSEDFERSLAILTGQTDRSVSAHFLLPDPADKPYLSSNLKVYALVNTSDRAWHAGQSYWAGKTGLNDQSIGIEIVNLSGCNTDIAKLGNSAQFGTACQFVPFRDEQIVLLTRLLKELLKQYPDIKPESVVGHADIAPSRKVDPGPLFPWKTLHDAGIGAWFDESRASELVVLLDQHPLTIRQQQVLLAAYGYDLSITGLEDEPSQLALRAFQMHFRPANYSGFFDNESTARLISLLERYRPRVLASLDDFPAALHTQQQ